MPLSATSLVWDWVWVWDWIHWHTEQIKDIIIGTLLLACAPLLLSSLLSHTIPFPRVHLCVVVRLVHTGPEGVLGGEEEGGGVRSGPGEEDHPTFSYHISAAS
jgi:hypothetical protein